MLFRSVSLLVASRCTTDVRVDMASGEVVIDRRWGPLRRRNVVRRHAIRGVVVERDAASALQLLLVDDAGRTWPVAWGGETTDIARSASAIASRLGVPLTCHC